MSKKAIINNGIGSKVACSVIDGTTLEALPVSGIDNGDGTSTMEVIGSVEVTELTPPETLPLPTGAATSALQTAGNASLESIVGVHIGGSVVITQNGTSQSVTVPALAKSFRIATRDGTASLNIGEAATDDSAIYVPDECVDYYPIDGATDTLYCYGTVGKAYFSFLG